MGMERALGQMRSPLARRFALFLAIWLFGCAAFQYTPLNANRQCATAPVQVVPIVLRHEAGDETDILWRAPLPGEKTFQMCLCDTVKKVKNGDVLPPKLDAFVLNRPVLRLPSVQAPFQPIASRDAVLVTRSLAPIVPPPVVS